jgi:hypothetical protein
VSDTIFGTSTPTVPDGSDGTPGITTATRIRANVDGTLDAVRWRCTDTRPDDDVVYFLNRYDPAHDGTEGVLIDSATVDRLALTPGAYNVFPLTGGSVAVAAGDEFLVRMFTTKNYCATGAFFAANVVSGGLTGPADEDPARRNGRFAINASPQWPTSGFNANGYHVDAVFTVAAPPVDVTLAAVATAATLTTSVAATDAAALAATAQPATLTNSSASGADVALAATAQPALLAITPSAASDTTMGATAAPASLTSVLSTGANTVVPRPNTGTITRPDTGTIRRPTRVYP